MDLRTLNYVTTAVRLESITKAAAELHVAQSAVSRAIKLLEEELGVVLLLRHTHGVKATLEGVKFVESAETLLRLARQLREEMRSFATEPLGTIRFGFPPSQGQNFIDVLIAGFVKKYPHVGFQLREALTGELTEALLADKLDLAVMLYDAKHPDLQRKPLFAEDTWLVGEASIWPFGSKPLNPSQLNGLPLLHTRLVGESLRKLGAKRKLHWRVVAEGDVTRVAPEVVRTGGGYWLIPHAMIADDIARGLLAGAPVKGLEFRRGLFWRADRPHSRALTVFMEELDKAVAALKAARPDIIKHIKADK